MLSLAVRGPRRQWRRAPLAEPAPNTTASAGQGGNSTQAAAAEPNPAPAPTTTTTTNTTTASTEEKDDLILIFRPAPPAALTNPVPPAALSNPVPPAATTNNVSTGAGGPRGAGSPAATAVATTNTSTPTPPPCDALTLLRGPAGAFGTPRYAPRTACGWILDPGYAPIRLTVVRFETEPGYDTLYVMALSPAGLRTPVAELSGRYAAGRTILVPAARAFIGFLSDSSVEGGGWEFTWDRCPACAPVAEVTAPAGVLSAGAPPSDGGGAVAGTRCEWQVRPPAGPVALTLTRLSLPVGASLAVQGATRAPLRLLTGDRGGRLPVVQVPASARGPAGDDAVFVVFDGGPTPGGGFALKWELLRAEEGGAVGAVSGAPGRGGGVLGAARPRSPPSPSSSAAAVAALGGPRPPPDPPFKDDATLAREEAAASAAGPDLGWDGFFVPPGAARAIIAAGALAGGAVVGAGIGLAAVRAHALVVHRRYGGRWATAPGLRWVAGVAGGVDRLRRGRDRGRSGRRGGGEGPTLPHAAPAPPPAAVSPAGSPAGPRTTPPDSPRRRRPLDGGGQVALSVMRSGGGGGGCGGVRAPLA